MSVRVEKNKLVREVLNTLLAQMEQAESVEDCLILVEDMLAMHPDICFHEIEMPPHMNGQNLPPGAYDRAAIGNEEGFRVQFFEPINVQENDSKKCVVCGEPAINVVRVALAY